MPMLSAKQKSFLWDATVQYLKAGPGSRVAEYSESRGLPLADISRFGIGFVSDPLPGHEMYRGMMSIPYMRRSATGDWSVATIRFRCLEPDCDHSRHPGGKYATVAGDTPRLFNTDALSENSEVIGICEGELDALTASISGIPTVGVPGAKNWKPYWAPPFLGYETVFIFADGDKAGDEFAHEVAKKLPNTRIIPCRPGEDINSEYVKHGADYILEKIV